MVYRVAMTGKGSYYSILYYFGYGSELHFILYALHLRLQPLMFQVDMTLIPWSLVKRMLIRSKEFSFVYTLIGFVAV